MAIEKTKVVEERGLKVGLHCNLPYPSNVANPALGYLKGCLKGFFPQAKVRNIYWNLVFEQEKLRWHLDLVRELFTPLGREKISSVTRAEEGYFVGLFLGHFARRLYASSSAIPSLLSPLLEFAPPFSDLKPSLKMETLVQETKEVIEQYIEQKKLYSVDLAGFTMNIHQWLFNYYILLRLKGRTPELKTVIGGVTDLPQALEFMKVFKEADLAIYGEGEIPLLRLVEALSSNSDLEKVPSLVYRENGKLCSTPPLQDLGNLNQYPFPEHDDYFEALDELKLHSIRQTCQIPLWGVRSCHWNRCKFCGENAGYTYRERDPQNVVQEIEYQAQKYGSDNFISCDTDVGRKRREDFDKFLQLLLESTSRRGRPYEIHRAELSPLRLDRKSISTMKKVKIEEVQAGFEALSDKLLRKMRKDHSFPHNIQVIKFACEQNFPLKGLNVLQGIPGETGEEVVESAQNLKFLRFYLHRYPLATAPMRLCRGSPFFEELSASERKSWNRVSYWPFWLEVRYLDFLAGADRYKFFVFTKDLEHREEWNIFERLLAYYVRSPYTYEWLLYPDGSSCILEDLKGKRFKKYLVRPMETQMLIFCDEVRKFSELRKKFSLNEKELKKILLPLHEMGFLYCGDMLISTISAPLIKKVCDEAEKRAYL